MFHFLVIINTFSIPEAFFLLGSLFLVRDHLLVTNTHPIFLGRALFVYSRLFQSQELPALAYQELGLQTCYHAPKSSSHTCFAM